MRSIEPDDGYTVDQAPGKPWEHYAAQQASELQRRLKLSDAGFRRLADMVDDAQGNVWCPESDCWLHPAVCRNRQRRDKCRCKGRE